jgi:long-chain acyl-CoA synthetase
VDDAAATAEAFTPDGWFRTGDLGLFDAQGYLHVVGRCKELIVLADGKKFFPEPIEKSYAESPLLKEVGIFERSGVLAAVIVPDEDEVRARGALREAASLREEIEDVAARLPPYQRITAYRVVRDALPRTQLGKLRRHLLPALFDGGEERPRDQVALSDADCKLLSTPLARDVWAWLARHYPDKPLSPDTSPQLDLAIDSLGWVSLTVDLEQQFGVTLRAEQLASILTLRDLLREVEAAAANRAPAAAAAPAYVKPGPALRVLGALLFVAVRLLVRLGLRPAVSGAEQLPSGPVLFTPNHASYLDPLVIAAALPWRRLRATYWAGWVGVMHTSPLRRFLSRATQVFPVDPDRDLAGAVRAARELLRQGYSVVWFPEGRRSLDGRLQEFQAGVGVLLQQTAAKTVPVAISGTFEAWPRQRRWPHRAPVAVAFGQPLDLRGSSEPAAIRRLLERAVGDLLASMNKGGSVEKTHDDDRSHRRDVA